MLSRKTVAVYENRKSQDSLISIVTGYVQDGRGLILGMDISFLHSVGTGSGVHPASYPMGTGGFFPESKAAGE
jgi:hypothetical protein